MEAEPWTAAVGAEASFILDDQQRITGWSTAASVLTGVPEEAALGRSCYEVVQGRDAFGRPVCGPDCPGTGALRNGHLSGHCWLFRRPPAGGAAQKWSCALVALPRPPGGGLVTLSLGGPGKTISSLTNDMDTQEGHLVRNSVGGFQQDLVALGTLATSLSPKTPGRSIDLALDWVRQRTSMEAAEVFLVEPDGGDMILTTYQGPWKSAFREIPRFHPGEGYPGLVVSQGQPIVTRHLLDDERYLRTRVKEKGFHSYVCVPLLESGRVIGTLNAASRQADLDLARAHQLLTWVAAPLSTVVQAGLLQQKEALGARSLAALLDAGGGVELLAQAVLREIVLMGDAVGGALYLYDATVPGLVRHVTQGVFSGAVCPDLIGDAPQACPALVGSHGVVLSGPRRHWPLACQQMRVSGRMVCCVPLVAGKERVGVVVLGYAAEAPEPPTRYLPALLALGQRAGEILWEAWVESRGGRLLRFPTAQTQGPAVPSATGSPALLRPPERAEASSARQESPFLELRCFGSFEVYRDGKLLSPETVQRRGALTLLKILVTHRGRSIPRDALVEMLWPEADPLAAANRLYGLVHSLRQVVEPHQPSRSWLYICSEGDRYYFNRRGPYRLDVEEFGEYIRLGERFERDGDATRAIESYAEAAALYRGDFLEDDLYAEWCQPEREYLRERCLELLRRLGALELERGALAKGIETYRRALRVDPSREENHRELMRALWMTGRRDEALRQYMVCRDLLRRELDVAPLRETEQLYLQIRGD